MEPITRKELFMAKAAGENVNVPEPITREEKYLKYMADNSVSKYFGESTEVLFDQRVELEGGDGVLSNALGLVVGETYEVTFNGTTYNLIAKPYDMEGTVIGNYIGDTVLAEYPFAIIEVYPEVSAEFGVPGDPILMTTGYLESATIRIEKSVIHTIDPKFLPGGGGGVVIVRDSAMASGIAVVDSDATATMNAAQIAEAIFAGKTVYFLEPNDGTLLPFVYGYRFGDLASGVMTLVAAPDPYALFGAHDSDGYYHRIKVYSDGIYYTDGFSVGS